MQVSLLSLRLQLSQCAIGPAAEPVLRVGRTCVAALWKCGCASVGSDFDAMTFIPCWLHERLKIGERTPTQLPARAVVVRELRANTFPLNRTQPNRRQPPAIEKRA
jgi:hypothetical protein